YPRKGTIAVGSDADIVVFDPEKKLTITAADQHSKTDYNLYEGTEVTGSPEVVLLRGNVLVEGVLLLAEPGIGQFVARAKFGHELKPAHAAAAAEENCVGVRGSAPQGPAPPNRERIYVDRAFTRVLGPS